MHYKWTLHSRTSKQVKHLWFAKLRIFSVEKKFVKFVIFYEWKKFVKFEFSIYARQRLHSMQRGKNRFWFLSTVPVRVRQCRWRKSTLLPSRRKKLRRRWSMEVWWHWRSSLTTVSPVSPWLTAHVERHRSRSSSTASSTRKAQVKIKVVTRNLYRGRGSPLSSLPFVPFPSLSIPLSLAGREMTFKSS